MKIDTETFGTDAAALYAALGGKFNLPKVKTNEGGFKVYELTRTVAYDIDSVVITEEEDNYDVTIYLSDAHNIDKHPVAEHLINAAMDAFNDALPGVSDLGMYTDISGKAVVNYNVVKFDEVHTVMISIEMFEHFLHKLLEALTPNK